MDWRMADVLKLINLYKQFECLWNYRSEEYKRIDLKKEAWSQISNECDRCVDEVKRKMKHLRTVYVVEKKKVDNSKKSGALYESHLYYYSEFSFLDPFVVLRKTMCNLKSVSVELDIEAVESDPIMNSSSRSMPFPTSPTPSESSTSSVARQFKLNKRQTTNFINLYRKLDCLWNIKSANYKRNDLRRKSWERLAYQLNSTVDEAKIKIKHLRSSYLSQKKKVDKYKRNGQIYEPKLFYYNEFHFLDGLVQQRRLPAFEERNCSGLDETSNANNDMTDGDEVVAEEEEGQYDTEANVKQKGRIDFEENNSSGDEESKYTSKRAGDDEVYTTSKRIRVKKEHITETCSRKLDLEEKRFAFESKKALRELDLREKEIERDERIKILEIESKERIAMKELELKYNCYLQE